MKALVVSGYGIGLSVRRGSVVLKTKDGVRAVPLSEVDAVVVTTSGVSVTARAVRSLTRHGVMLVFLDSRGMPASILHHPFATRTVETRRAQYEALLTGRAAGVIKAVALSKIGNQAGFVKRLKRELGRRELEDLEREILGAADRVGRLNAPTVKELRAEAMNVEAAAARCYWAAVASVLPRELGFDGRDQDGCDPVNCALNYGYGMIYPVVWRSVSIHGLDPYAGFLHADRSGKPALTFDVIEAFRVPAVDAPLVRALRAGLRPQVRNCLLDKESRVKVASIVIKALREKHSAYGEVRDLEGWINSFTASIASYLRGESPLRPLVFRW